MGIGEQISRKKALEAATKAVEQADLLTVKHNETIDEVGRIRAALAVLTEHTGKRLDAQLEMIGACERRITTVAADVTRLSNQLADDVHTIRTTFANEQRHYVDTQDKAEATRVNTLLAYEANRVDRSIDRISTRHYRFTRMTFFERLRWLFTGEIAGIKVERGMVSAGGLQRPVGDPGTDPRMSHETPRSAKTARSRDEAEALCR